MEKKEYVPAFIFKPTKSENTNVTKIRRQDDLLELEFPVFTKDEVLDIAQTLHMRKRKAHNRSIEELIEIMVTVGELWRDPNFYLRKKALNILPMITGQSRQLCEAELDGTLSIWSKDMIELYLAEDLGNKMYLDEWILQPNLNIKLHAQPRGLVYHNLAGNAFSVGMGSLFYGMLTKNVNLVKLPREEPFFTALFAQSIREIDRKVGNELAVLYWPGSKSEIFDELFNSGYVDSVIAWGGLQSIEEIRKRANRYGIKIINHGPKLSFSIISEDIFTSEDKMREMARRIAVDASFWNQKACFSPRVIYIKQKPKKSALDNNKEEIDNVILGLQEKISSETSPKGKKNKNKKNGRDIGALMQRSATLLKNEITELSPIGFAKILAEEMKLVGQQFPRAHQTEADGMETVRKREYFSMNYELNQNGQLITPKIDNKLDWTVMYLRNPPTMNEIDMFQDRFICVTRISNILDLVHSMREEGLNQYLQTISIEGNEKFIEEVAEEMSLLGAARFPKVGDHNQIVMGAPWDGHYVLTELVRWVYIEKRKNISI
ncbi:MAG: hypothetical protein GF364_01885 [Candidatus Lokiarchaeota archaeon]|nr:hypothetical protein [Candidatus Lokiarchaeota archaeon]